MTCEDCGCKVYNGACVNCHEETIILDQYIEQDLPAPSKEFLDKVDSQREAIKKNKKKAKHVRPPREIGWDEILDNIDDRED